MAIAIRSPADALDPPPLGYLHDWGVQKARVRKLEATRQAWRFFRPLNTFWCLHQVGRTLLAPFHELVNYLPERGTLLDLGCGHGLFLAVAKRQRPELQLIGLDLSNEKITAAQIAFRASSYPMPELNVMDIADFPELSVDVISIIDVLYLVPIEQWDRILKKCHKCLNPGGKLIFKEMNRAIRWKFALLYLQETLAVKIFGLTMGKEFTFPNREEIHCHLRHAGFEVEETPLHRGYPFPHQLWIGRKPQKWLVPVLPSLFYKAVDNALFDLLETVCCSAITAAV